MLLLKDKNIQQKNRIENKKSEKEKKLEIF